MYTMYLSAPKSARTVRRLHDNNDLVRYEYTGWSKKYTLAEL